MKIVELSDRLSNYGGGNDDMVAFRDGKFRKVRYLLLNVYDADNNFIGLTLETETEETE